MLECEIVLAEKPHRPDGEGRAEGIAVKTATDAQPFIRKDESGTYFVQADDRGLRKWGGR